MLTEDSTTLQMYVEGYRDPSHLYNVQRQHMRHNLKQGVR